MDMEKKVSVSQFLRAAARAPGARTRSRPKAKAAPPRPSPRPAATAPSGPPKDWRALAGGRPVPWWLYGTILFATTILAIAGVNKQNNVPTPAPPRHYDVPQSQGPAAWSDTPPSPAPDHTPVAAPEPSGHSLANLSLIVTSSYSVWYGVEDGFFDVKNSNFVDVKDLTILCLDYAPSGTIIGKHIGTVYQIFPARQTRSIGRFRIGFVDPQSTGTSCEIIDYKPA